MTISILGLGLLIIFPDSWMLLAFCFSFSLGFLLMTPVHELAHASMAKLLGMSVYDITIGTHGRVLKEFMWGRCHVTIKRGLDGGHMSAMSASPRWLRLRHWLVTAVGPCVHLATVATLWPYLEQNDGHLWWQWFVYFAFFTNAIMLWSSVVPFSTVNWTAGRYNDAMLLLWFPFAKKSEMTAYHAYYFVSEANYQLGKHDVAEMRRVLEEGLRHYPENLALQSMNATAAALAGEYELAQTIFDKILSDPQGHPDVIAYTRMHRAWTELARYPSLDHQLIESLTKASMDELPWIRSFQGLRGCALIANGNHVEGVPLVIDAREEGCWFEQAIYETYLALASMRRDEWED